MKRSYDSIKLFLDDLHEESMKDILLNLGYLQEDDFKGSKIACPFHDDKTPSLHIAGSHFMCYGCGASGDVINYIQLADNFNFYEAVTKLAESMYIDIKKDHKMSEYDKKLREFQGYWKRFVDNFNNAIKKNDALAQELKEQSKSFFPLQIGYNELRGYLVIPFTSKTGHILGFTNRVLHSCNAEKGENRPKWVHSTSKNSLIENCGNIVNLDKSHRAIHKSKKVIIVEGPRDIASVMRAGYKSVVSISGTSNFNKKTLDILGDADDFIFMLDGDNAGQKAIYQSLRNLAKLKPAKILTSSVVKIPSDKDPGEMDKDAIKHSINSRINAIDWLTSYMNRDQLKEFYKESPNLVNSEIILRYSKYYGYSFNDFYSLIEEAPKQENDSPAEYGYKEQLMSTVGLIEDINIPPLNIELDDAKRILRLRYGISI